MPANQRIVDVSLTVLRGSEEVITSDQNCCLHCEARLDLLQPNKDLPDRLLGVCEVCGVWHLIEQGGGEWIIAMLPDGNAIRNVLAFAPANPFGVGRDPRERPPFEGGLDADHRSP